MENIDHVIDELNELATTFDENSKYLASIKTAIDLLKQAENLPLVTSPDTVCVRLKTIIEKTLKALSVIKPLSGIK